jgi:hypothetical protein
MKTMTKIIIGMGLGSTIPIIAGLTVVLFATAGQQTALTLLYSKIPAALSNTFLEAAILQNEPEEAVAILRKQASYVRMLGNNSFMKQSLVEDTYMVYEAQITSHGYLALSNWIDELQQLLGDYDSYWFRVMQGHVAAVVERNASTDSEYEIASVFPAFDRPYRPRIENAIYHKNYNKLKEWCREYDEAKYNFIALNPYSRNRYLRGAYDGSIVLLADGGKSPMSQSDIHPAFLTDEFVPYKFAVKREDESRMLRLSFRSVPGIRMRLESIAFERGQKRTTYSQNDLLYVGKSGFILDDGSYLLADNMQADVLTLYPRDGLFPPSETISISLRFEKLPFVNHEYCQTTRPTE